MSQLSAIRSKMEPTLFLSAATNFWEDRKPVSLSANQRLLSGCEIIRCIEHCAPTSLGWQPSKQRSKRMPAVLPLPTSRPFTRLHSLVMSWSSEQKSLSSACRDRNRIIHFSLNSSREVPQSVVVLHPLLHCLLR